MSSGSQKSENINVNVYVSKNLRDSIQDAKKEGRSYHGKLFTNGLAFELGAKILLGIAENEEEIAKQKLEDLEIQKNSINSQICLMNEQLERSEAKKKSIRAQCLKEKQDVELLASKIINLWDSVVIYKDKKNIDFIVNYFDGKLTREKVESVFPSKYEPVPTHEEAFQIASCLLGYKGDVGNV